MDTDMFNTMTDNQQVIVYPLVKHDFVIPKNTPIVQVVPYRRENWTASYIHRDFSSLVTEQDDRTSVYGKAPIAHHCRREGDVESPDNQIPGGFYRKYMWESKTKDFKMLDDETGEMLEVKIRCSKRIGDALEGLEPKEWTTCGMAEIEESFDECIGYTLDEDGCVKPLTGDERSSWQDRLINKWTRKDIWKLEPTQQ